MGGRFEEAPDTLRDDVWTAPTPFFELPAATDAPTDAWRPPLTPRGAEDLACFEPFADGPLASPHPNAGIDCPPESVADLVAGQCRVPAGVDPAARLERELMRHTDVRAKQEYDACLERERRIALSSCETGMFPDGREHPDLALEECVDMWVDGIPDRTTGKGTTRGSAHDVGGGFELGPEVFKINGGYNHTWSTEETDTRELTNRGVDGTREECRRAYLQRYDGKRKMGAP